MASGLLQALLGAQYKPTESAFGIGANAIGASLPYLQNPYASSGKNIAYTAGAGLLAGLLGGMARNETNQRNKELMGAWNQYQTATPEQQESILDAHPGLASVALLQQQDAADAKRKFDEAIRLQGAKKTEDLRAEDLYYSSYGRPSAQRPSSLEGALSDEPQKVVGPTPQPIKFHPKSPQYAAQQDAIKNERALAGDFGKINTDYQYKVETYNALEKAYEDKGGVSDFEMIRRGSQMVEPGLAVRRDDEESLQRAASLWGLTKAKLLALANGTSQLDDKTRRGIMRMAQRSLNSSVQNFNLQREKFLAAANRYGLDPSFIVPTGAAEPVSGGYDNPQPPVASNVVKGPDGQMYEFID